MLPIRISKYHIVQPMAVKVVQIGEQAAFVIDLSPTERLRVACDNPEAMWDDYYRVLFQGKKKCFEITDY